MAVTDRKSFDDLFGFAAVMKNPNKPLPNDLFEKKMVVAALRCRRAFWTTSSASLSSRAAWASFLPQMFVVTALSSRAAPSCSKVAERNSDSSSGAVPRPMSGSRCAPLKPS